MHIFITGNLGYIGASLCKYLRKKYPAAFLAGFDLGYFQHCLTTPASTPEHTLNVQFYGDVRDLNENLLSGFDHIIHLAAISNDPVGNQFEAVTLEVNYDSTIRLAELAIKKGIKSFVLASSCSVYGAGGNESKTESSEVKPLTAYARSKVLAEEGLKRLNSRMVTTCLRFATACGMTDRLRLDLVLNDFVASALTSKQINILSDGTPWRPLINVNDMCLAFDWAMGRSKDNGGNFLVCNTGSNDWNFTVSELAERVRNHFQDVQVTVNEHAVPDKRSYRVNFDKYSYLAKQFTPLASLDETILELKQGLESIQFNDVNFRESKLMRLNVLNSFFSIGDLDRELHWV